MIDFKGHRVEKDIILLCVRWYLAYPLSYLHLEEMMEERGVQVDHSNINHWVQKFTILSQCCSLPSCTSRPYSTELTHA
jgi:putative transposase